MSGSQTRERRGSLYLLWAILVLATAARLAGIGFGLPNVQARPDESVCVSVAMYMAKSGLHPGSFFYPTLFPTLLLGLYGAYFAGGYLTGQFPSLEAFKGLYYVDPTSFYLIARGVSAASGVLTVYLVFVLGRRLFSVSAGLLSALFLALCPVHVRDSHFGKVDVLVTFLITLAGLSVLDIYRQGRLKDFIYSGVLSGLATSTKYNAGVLCVSIFGAHLLRCARQGWGIGRRVFHPHLWLAAVAMAVAFLLGSPFVLIDLRGFWSDFLQVAKVMSGEYHGKGSYGSVDFGPGWIYHLTFSLRYGLGLGMEALAVAGLAWAAVRRNPEELIALSLMVFFLLIGNGRWTFTRYVIPVVPTMLVFAAGLLLRVGAMVVDRRRRLAILWGAVGLVIAEPGLDVVQLDRVLLGKDTRLQAAEWIRRNIPDGATIGLHKGYYAEPPLAESEGMLRERLKGNPGPNRDSYLLEHPQRPGYRLIRLGYFESRDQASYSWIETDYEPSRLKGIGLEYLVTAESPLSSFAGVDGRIRSVLDSHGTAIVQFDPFAPGSSPQPIYDPQDAFFVPMAGFKGVERPGPRITIYRLHLEE